MMPRRNIASDESFIAAGNRLSRIPKHRERHLRYSAAEQT